MPKVEANCAPIESNSKVVKKIRAVGGAQKVINGARSAKQAPPRDKKRPSVSRSQLQTAERQQVHYYMNDASSFFYEAILLFFFHQNNQTFERNLCFSVSAHDI